MYALISKRIGGRAATVVTGVVYAVMIMLILYAALYPQTELKYTAL